MNYKHMTSPCGLDCFNCPMYLASNDPRLRAEITKATGLPYEKALCKGCRDSKGTIAFMGASEPCEVYTCTGRKGLSFCHECSDFPCDHLHPFTPPFENIQSNPHFTTPMDIDKQSWREYGLA